MLNNLYTPRVVHARSTAASAGASADASAASAAADQAQRQRTNRRVDEFRTVRMQTGVVKHASGSAHVEIGRTKVVCSVFGPRAVTGRAAYSDDGSINCDVKFAPFACASGRRGRGQSPDERVLCRQLQHALEPAVLLHKLPKLELSIFVLVVEADGGHLGAAITAASLALADAHVECYDLVAGCSLAVAEARSSGGGGASGGEARDGAGQGTQAPGFLLDPTLVESRERPTMTMATMPALKQVNTLLQTGAMSASPDSPTSVSAAMDLCAAGCNSIHALMQRCLTEAASKKMQQYA